MKILEVLNHSTTLLTRNGIEHSRLNAERLLCHTLDRRRIDLYLNSDQTLTEDELKRFREHLSRRLRNEPLQYILGETEFMSLPFRVNPAVLIPRPETEVLVERVVKWCHAGSACDSKRSILDIGTGSGCIAVSLAKYLKNAKIIATDVSEGALEIARENAALNRVSEELYFIEDDILQSQNLRGERFDVIVSNPPYVPAGEYEDLPAEIKDHEPTIALKSDPDGLCFYRSIAGIAAGMLNAPGLLALEVGLGQADRVKAICEANGFREVSFSRDLNGIERVVTCTK